MLVTVMERHIATRANSFWQTVETAIYIAVAGVIAVTAVIALSACGFVLWQGLHTWNYWDTILEIIDAVLLVLMLVEILHTVRMSVHSHGLVAEPFLIVGLIATIRRILVVGLQSGNLAHSETWDSTHEAQFHASVLELGLLGLLLLIFVVAIYLLRRNQSSSEVELT